MGFAVWVVMIAGHLVSRAVDQLHHIPLEIGDVIIGLCRAGTGGVGQGIWGPLGIICEVQDFCGDRSILRGCGDGLPKQSAAGIEITVFFRDGRHQNPLVDAAGAVRLLKAVLGNGRFRVDGDGDDGGLVGGSAAATAVVDVLGVFSDFYVVVPQLGDGVVPVTVTTGTFVEGVTVCGAGGGHHGCGIVVGMVGAGGSAAGADVYHSCIGWGLLVIVAQGGGFVCLVAVTAGALVEGVALFGTGGGHHSGLIVMFLHPPIGLAGHLFLRPQAVQIIGVGDGGVHVVRRGAGGSQLPAVFPGEVPAGAVEIADGVAAFDRSIAPHDTWALALTFIQDFLTVDCGQ